MKYSKNRSLTSSVRFFVDDDVVVKSVTTSSSPVVRKLLDVVDVVDSDEGGAGGATVWKNAVSCDTTQF